ncbi:MAG TPA: alpha amylase C-terminal domain-containing protein [Candidatus Acidoferrales bacterium]|nr:alpha amylase C-terminal domain-containing protein [Candidatus Acidoferrales bacterium]
MNATEQLTNPVSSGPSNTDDSRAIRCAPDQPIAIYQVHLQSWMRMPDEGNRALTYSEIAPKLSDYLQHLRFTHVQLVAPDYLDPSGLRFLVEFLQRQNLGVILETTGPLRATVSFGPDDFPADGQFLDGCLRLHTYNYKWDIAWAEETTAYFGTDPLYRKIRQRQFTHRDVYAFDSNYVLPLADRIVAQSRPSLHTIMPGDAWQKLANLRLLFAYMYLLPGKKLMFMGNEFGQQNTWRPETSLDWHLVTTDSPNGKLLDWVANLNRFYRDERALHQTDVSAAGFQWVDTDDAERSVISFLRRDAEAHELLLAVLNFTPVPRYNYRVGVPQGGFWTERLNSDAMEFGGSGQGNLGGLEAAPFGWNFQSHSLMLTLPPLGATVLKAPMAGDT